MAWSEAQMAAIETYDKNLLVAAAAGSGKTSVLVERIIRRILDESQNFNINEVLVVTFTNAAAAEMRERIGRAIEKALKENPKSRHLKQQLALLNAASISTLHAFCQSVIRQNFHLIDLDPKFRLASTQEISLLQREVLEILFEEYYEENDEEFLTLIDHYGDEHGDEVLYEIILRLYEFSSSQPAPVRWLRQLSQSFAIGEEATINDTIWSAIIKKEVTLILKECMANASELKEMAEAYGYDTYVPVLGSDIELFSRIESVLAESWDTVYQAVQSVKFAALRAPKEILEEHKEYFAQQRDSWKAAFNKIKENYFNASEEEQLSSMREVHPLMETVCRIAEEFSNAFLQAKQAKAILDFNDLEHFCLKILSDGISAEGVYQPSTVAKILQEKYREVMVDEYQDVNGVQEAILLLVRQESRANLFLVGDVKQSIYRFRLAEPELFLAKYRSYPERGDDFARIDLAQNFRSRSGVLAAINFLFVQLMEPKIAELSYGESEKLNSGLIYPDADNGFDDVVELHLIDRDDKGDSEGDPTGEDTAGFALECEYVADRILSLMQQGQVFDKLQDQYRPVQWRDIVILLRSVKYKADVLLEALRSRNIPAYANTDTGYFQEIEVQVMLALLQVIDNPRQDIPLAAVLYSSLVGLSEADLATIRLLAPNEPLFESLLKASGVESSLDEETKEKVMNFLITVNRWRNLARQSSVPELIWQLYRDTAYYEYVGGMPGGILRQANLRMLYDRAREYETTNFRGLFRFLRFIEKMRDADTDLAVARTLGESENVVRVMSIHKSKGLEFPIVIVADLGKKFNLLDSKAVMLMHKKLGLGPYVTNAKVRLRYPTIARRAIACQLDRESKAEELRVLYVALTRAREKLILIGSVAKLAVKLEYWQRSVGGDDKLLPDYTIAGADCYLDWLCPAVARHKDAVALRSSQETGARGGLLLDDSKWNVTIVAAGSLNSPAARSEAAVQQLECVLQQQSMLPSENAAWVGARLGWRYAEQSVAAVPAKLSVTEMKRRFDVAAEHMSGMADDLVFKRPRFIGEITSLTGAEYGVLMHSVMQHLDLTACLSVNSIKGQIESMVSREIISHDHAMHIDSAMIARFFAGDIGRRMLASSSSVRRELPFSIMLQADRFYPEAMNPEEEIFVQGVIDVMFDEGDGLVLVDYKTDGGKADVLAAKYRMQLLLYAEAIEQIFRRTVKEKFLYSFGNGNFIKVE